MLTRSQRLLLPTLRLALLTAAVAFAAAVPIHLTSADLGRHLTSGRLLLEHGDVLTTNFYAQDTAATPVINHHWLSGLVFYWIHQTVGFSGLSVTYLTLLAGAFATASRVAWRRGGAWLGLGLAALVLPLIACRTEVRPEGFSYALTAAFLFILGGERGRQKSRTALWLLPPLMMLWVNLHIYFAFGLGLTTAAWLEACLRRCRGEAEGAQQFKLLSLCLAATTAATLVNPFGWRLALYPLHIFDNYGYLVAENQSLWFLHRLGLELATATQLLTAGGVLALGAGLAASSWCITSH